MEYNTIRAQECLSVVFMYVTEVSCLARANVRKEADKTPLNLKLIKQVDCKPFIYL